MFHFKKYLLTYFALTGASLTLLVPNYFYLKNSGEFLGLDEIASRQARSEEQVIYGSAVHDDFFPYKRILYEKVKAKVVVLGSSRVMKFQSKYFTESFITMGGSMSSIDEGLYLLNKIIADGGKPEAVILGVDFWWFSPKNTSKIRSEDSSRFTFHKLILPFHWLINRKITFGDYLAKANPFRKNSSTLIGVSANTKGSGFLPDGSYLYSQRMDAASHMKHVEATGTEVKKGVGKFIPAKNIDSGYFSKFVKMLELLKSKNIRTVVFLTPVAPLVAREMDNSGEALAYVRELKAELARNRIYCYDFINPAVLGATDSEFIDGLHGNGLTCARILAHIYNDEKSGFQPFINIKEVNQELNSPNPNQ